MPHDVANMNTDTPLLDEVLADFIQHHVSINVATRDAGNLPTLTRALGCRVSPDRRRITVFISVPRSEELLRNLRDNGAIAAVFSRPTTHQTIQVKASDATIVALEDGDRALMAAYGATFIEDIRQIGYQDPFASAMVSAVDEEAVGIAFTPTAAFVQTPGPAAGQPLRS
jgi:hypothetical protein